MPRPDLEHRPTMADLIRSLEESGRIAAVLAEQSPGGAEISNLSIVLYNVATDLRESEQERGEVARG